VDRICHHRWASRVVTGPLCRVNAIVSIALPGTCAMCSAQMYDDENRSCNMRSLRSAKAKTRLADISLTM